MSIPDTNEERGYFKNEEFDKPVIVKGLTALNFANDLDKVIIELLPVVQWQKIHAADKQASKITQVIVERDDEEEKGPVVILDSDKFDLSSKLKIYIYKSILDQD